MTSTKNMFLFVEEELNFCLESATLLEELTANYSKKAINLEKDRFSVIQSKTSAWYQKVLPLVSLHSFSFIEKELVLYFVDLINKIINEIHLIVSNLYYFQMSCIHSYMPVLTKNITNCVKLLDGAVKAMNNLETKEQLKSFIVKINFLETQTNSLYTNAICALYCKPLDNCIILYNKVIYESIENCCNMCQQAAEMLSLFY